MIRFENLWSLAGNSEQVLARARAEAWAAIEVLSNPAYDAAFCSSLAQEAQARGARGVAVLDQAHGTLELAAVALVWAEKEGAADA